MNKTVRCDGCETLNILKRDVFLVRLNAVANPVKLYAHA